MTKAEYRGSCHCGAVRYHCLGAPSFQFLCHCDNCRRLNGGMRLAGLSFSARELAVDGATQSYEYQGGKGRIEAHFCPRCGTHLFAYPRAFETVVIIRANSLLDQTQFRPEKSVYPKQICPWESPVARPTWHPPLAT